MKIGALIKRYRKLAGMTQTELAHAVGVTQSAIGKYEADERTPSYETIEDIANALNIQVADLLFLSSGTQVFSSATEMCESILMFICTENGYHLQLTTYTDNRVNYLIYNDSEQYSFDSSQIGELFKRFYDDVNIDFQSFLWSRSENKVNNGKQD